MFKVSSLRANTRLQMLSPLVDSRVENTAETALNVNQSLLEFVDIVDLHLVHMLLHDSIIITIKPLNCDATRG